MLGWQTSRKSSSIALKASGWVTLMACAPHGAMSSVAPGIAAASCSDIEQGTSTSSRAAEIRVGVRRLARWGVASNANSAAMRRFSVSAPWKPLRPCASSCAARSAFFASQSAG